MNVKYVPLTLKQIDYVCTLSRSMYQEEKKTQGAKRISVFVFQTLLQSTQAITCICCFFVDGLPGLEIF